MGKPRLAIMNKLPTPRGKGALKKGLYLALDLGQNGACVMGPNKCSFFKMPDTKQKACQKNTETCFGVSVCLDESSVLKGT